MSDLLKTVVLRGGLRVAVTALDLLWRLEDRGFSLVVDGDRLLVDPGDRLTAEDCAAIRRWKADLTALVHYDPPAMGSDAWNKTE